MNADTPFDHDNPRLWKALSDPTRRQILDLLHHGPLTTGALATAIPELSRYAVMKHLGVLEEANLVAHRRAGRERWNVLNTEPLREMNERWTRTLDARKAMPARDFSRMASLLGARATGSGGPEMTDETMMDTDVRTEDQSGSQAAPATTMHIEQSHDIAAPVDIVWKALTQHMDAWWRQPFRLHGGKSTMHIDARPGGALAEQWYPHGFAVWGWVSRWEPQRSVEFVGPCGMDGAVNGRFAFTVHASESGTTLTLTHDASGMLPDNAADSYMWGWHEMLTTLKDQAEGPLRYGKAPQHL